MKTKEFIRRVEELGFECEKSKEVYFIYDSDGIAYASVYHTTPYQISTFERPWDLLTKDEQEKLFDLLIEYARTPIEDREEEKKFYLRHRYLQSSLTNSNNILNYSVSDNTLALSTGAQCSKYKTKFTLKEIEEIKEKLNTDLTDFELVEVEK